MPPLDATPKGQEIPLAFKKNGTGSLFYSASMKYALPAAKQTARDEGISLFTQIIDVKTGTPVVDGKLQAGRLYREKVFVSTTKARTFVAVRAPVPAGCEIINAAFATTARAPAASSDDADEDVWLRDDGGLSYQGIYDSEVQYFWNVFPRGNASVDFLFRAVRKGSYGVPSATAECMYEEDIFGRLNETAQRALVSGGGNSCGGCAFFICRAPLFAVPVAPALLRAAIQRSLL